MMTKETMYIFRWKTILFLLLAAGNDAPLHVSKIPLFVDDARYPTGRVAVEALILPSSAPRWTGSLRTEKTLCWFSNPHRQEQHDPERGIIDDPSGIAIAARTRSTRMQLFASENKKPDEDGDSNVADDRQAQVLRSLQSKLVAITTSDQFKVGIVTFLAGIIFTLVVLFVPDYGTVTGKDTVFTEPVALFGTILSTLEKRYVDKVDTQKLFETAVSAMVNSLDPYTEFEGKQQTLSLNEITVKGKYGGVGLVIAGRTKDSILKEQKQQASDTKLKSDGQLDDAVDDLDILLDDLEQGDIDEMDVYTKSLMERSKQRGIQVVSAMEGYAYDYGMRVGDKLIAIDDNQIIDTTTVEDVKDMLRGQPGEPVTIAFEREGVPGIQRITMPRSVVRLRDVKLVSFLGEIKDRIGYIDLRGFTSDASVEVFNAISTLQIAAASDSNQPLQGLVLDLRDNAGGLLNSAVEIASLLIPKGSVVVSAKGREFPNVVYRNMIDPIIDTSQTKLVVLVNGNTASAAEIVSGAIQDLDVGIVLGTDRTFGKGLVQTVQPLPSDTSLKLTVAKYYTPSGRCIQGINYSEGGGGSNIKDKKYIEDKVKDKDRNTFYTKNGRVVKDGGGIEADFKVPIQKISVLEATLLQSGAISDFAALWSRNHQLTNYHDLNDIVNDKLYEEFQDFVKTKQKNGDLKLDLFYSGGPRGGLNDLKTNLKKSGYTESEKELNKLREAIIQDVFKDFERYKSDIKQDIEQTILARYLPESMLLERSIQTDKQVEAAIKLIKNERKFNSLLAKKTLDGNEPSNNIAQTNAFNVASSSLSPSLSEENSIMRSEKEKVWGSMMNLEW